MGQKFISAIIDAFSRGEAHCGIRGAQRCPKGILRGLLCPFPALFHRSPPTPHGSPTDWLHSAVLRGRTHQPCFGQFGQSNGPSIWYILSILRHLLVFWRSGILTPKYNHKTDSERYGPKYQKKAIWVFSRNIIHYRPRLFVFLESWMSQNGLISSITCPFWGPGRAQDNNIKINLASSSMSILASLIFMWCLNSVIMQYETSRGT